MLIGATPEGRKELVGFTDLEGGRRGLAENARAALLVAQDRERARQAVRSPQPKAKRALQEIWMAETSVAAELAVDVFIESYALKYEKVADCMSKDQNSLLAF